MRSVVVVFIFFFSSRRRHTRSYGDWSSDVCSSDFSASVRARTPATAFPAGAHSASSCEMAAIDRKSGVEGKRGGRRGGRRSAKKKNNRPRQARRQDTNQPHIHTRGRARRDAQ